MGGRFWPQSERENPNTGKEKRRTLRKSNQPVAGPGGDAYKGLYGEAPPERGIFFRLQAYKRVGIPLVEVYERVGKSVVSVCKKDQKG